MTQDMVSSSPRFATFGARVEYAPFAAFAAFGIFWGAWGAALPTLRTEAGVSEGQLGTALLFVGLGALPSMAFTGRAVDRFGVRVVTWLLAALAVAGLLISAGADGIVRLVVGMLLVGAASGAADVGINTLAGRAEHVTAKPLLTRSHGLFSVGVVIASLSTGALLGVGLSLPATFAVVALVMLVLAAWSRLAGTSLQVAAHQDDAVEPRDPRGVTHAGTGPDEAGSRTRTSGGLLPRISQGSPLVVVGLVAALAYAIENAHQSWGAVMMTDVFTATPQLAAAAPAAFAATAALARLTLAPVSRSHPGAVLIGGGAVATAGSTVLATAPSVGVALVGLVLGALGTATLFPTLLSRSLRGTDPAQHGRATSAVATTAYLGFLLGPAYVGLLAETTDLRGALVGVAALAGAFTVAAPPISRWAAGRSHVQWPPAGAVAVEPPAAD